MDNTSEQVSMQRGVAAAVLAALGVNVLFLLIGWGVFTSEWGSELLAEELGLVQTPQTVIVDSAGERSAVVSAVEAANPAVVSIVVTKDVPTVQSSFREYQPFGNLGPTFRVPTQVPGGTEKREIGGGSGFLVSHDGYIVTNAHVVSDQEAQYTVFLNDGTSQEAEIVAVDEMFDIAVIKIDADSLAYLEFGNSDEVKVGQTVIAIGNALGEYRNTVSVGVVSGLSRSIVASDQSGSSEQLYNILQTDAAINPGNSGGPLLDVSGRVIGVNVAASLGSENIGFALPGNTVRSAVESIRENGYVVRPYLGVRFVAITEALKEQNDLSVDHGALVLRGDNGELAVIPGSPADKAGLEENDVILEANGQQIDLDHPLQAIIAEHQIGDTLSLRVLHDGDEEEVEVTLEERPTDEE